MKRSKDKLYAWGFWMTVLGGASLSDHICHGVDAFPLSAVVFGIGFILILFSYGKEKR